MHPLRSLLTVLVALLLAGCSSGSQNNVVTPTSSGSSGASTSTPTPSATPVLTGFVTSGTLPVQNATVTLFEATAGAPSSLGTATTDSTGRYGIAATRTTSNSIFFVTARLGGGLQLVTVVGPTLPATVQINELTTVAAGFSMAQFISNGTISGEAFRLRIAASMNENLVTPSSGLSSPVLLNSPNGDETNSLRSTRSLANLLAFYVRGGGNGLATLFALLTPAGSPAPTTLLQALSNLARNPALNVSQIYALSKNVEVYAPSLANPPDAWTLVVKVNDSGNNDFLISGPGNIAYDNRGYAWITNNTVQGTGVSGNFAVVLQPNGKPSDGTNGTPPSPLFGGGLLGGGFGVAVDARQNVFLSNFGWGGVNPGPPPLTGSISLFDSAGLALSPSTGIQSNMDRAQGMAFDALGNLWLTSNGNSRVVVFLGGDPNKSIFFDQLPNTGPFNVTITLDGGAFVTSSGPDLFSDSPASYGRYNLAGGVLQQQYYFNFATSLKGSGTDSLGNVWMVSGGNNAVFEVNAANGAILGTFNGGGVNTPWGLTIDGDDNVWVANFGLMRLGNVYSNASVSKLAGANPNTRPPGLNTGDPISPPSGYTLPSAGAQVLLHDGTPLYGPGAAPAFTPLMRQTAVPIDAAGNVWAVNNFKPDWDKDLAGNPGGDGICIFVGVAKPPRR